MSINPHVLPEVAALTPSPLDFAGVVRLGGRDAITFAQAQFANDVSKLADGQWQWNLWLSAKGRVLAIFALLRLDAAELILLLPDAPAAAFAQELARFKFRSKVDIAVLEDVRVHGAFAASTAHGNHAAIAREDTGAWASIALDLSATTPRTLWLQRSSAAEPAFDVAFNARWKLEDLAHGLPRLAPAQADGFTPQMLGLERLHAFSVTKGCYPGQEIVARTHFLGKAKRSLLRLALNGVVEAGAALRSAEGANADVVSVASDGECIQALAVAPLDATSASFRNEETGTEATPLALLEGLAR